MVSAVAPPLIEALDGGRTVQVGFGSLQCHEEPHGLADGRARAHAQVLHDGLSIDQRAFGGAAIGFGEFGDTPLELIDVVLELLALARVTGGAVRAHQRVEVPEQRARIACVAAHRARRSSLRRIP